MSIQKEVGSRLPSRAPLSNRSLFTESPTNKHRCTSSTRGWTQGLNIMSTVCGTVCLAQRPYYPIKIKALLTSCNYSRHKRQEIVHLSRWKKEDKKGTKTTQHKLKSRDQGESEGVGVCGRVMITTECEPSQPRWITNNWDLVIVFVLGKVYIRHIHRWFQTQQRPVTHTYLELWDCLQNNRKHASGWWTCFPHHSHVSKCH